MRFLFAIVFGLILQPFASADPDEIDHLVASLPHDRMWMSGRIQSINLPVDAPPAKVVEQIAKFENRGDQNNADRFHDYHILETKQVIFPRPVSPNITFVTFTAVLIASAKGSNTVILMSYRDVLPPPNPQNDVGKINPASGWWYRAFYITTAP